MKVPEKKSEQQAQPQHQSAQFKYEAKPAFVDHRAHMAQLMANQALMSASTRQQQLHSLQARMQDTAQLRVKPNNTGLPDQLKSGIESLSGLSMDHVKVHYNSDKPSQLQAHAYAQANEIHVAPGQEKHLPHEAWHVVQQAQGRVQPTKQMKAGIPVNDDQGLESEADVMGAKAMAQPVQRKLVADEPRSSGLPTQLEKATGASLATGVIFQRRGTPLTLQHAQKVVADKKKEILDGVQQTSDDFSLLVTHWPARLVIEANKPAIASWNTQLTQFNIACATVPPVDYKTLGTHVRNIVLLGQQLTALAAPASSALKPARDALVAANNDSALAAVVLLLGEACGGVAQGIAQIAPLGQLLQLAGVQTEGLLIRACKLAHDAAIAVAVASYLSAYTGIPKADAVSEKVLTDAAFDVSAATARMKSLAVWDYDLAMEAWSDSQSDVLAQEDVNKIKLDAQTEKERLEGILPGDPGSKPVRGKKEKKGEFDTRTSKWNAKGEARTAGLDAIALEEGKIAGADATKPAHKKQRQGEMVNFMTSWSASLGAEQAAWTLKAADGKEPVAIALASLQTSAQLMGEDKKTWATWAIGKSKLPAGIGALQSALETSILAGVAPLFARSLAEHQLTAKLSSPQFAKIAQAVATSPGELDKILQFIKDHSPLNEAITLLHRAVTVGHAAVDEVVAFCADHSVEDTEWALTKGAGNLKDSEKLLDLIYGDTTKEHLTKLLKHGTTAELTFLLNVVDSDKPNPDRLLKFFAKATAAQLSTLLARPDGFQAYKLDTWLLAKQYNVADTVTLVGLTTASSIEAMVSNSNGTPTTVLAAYNQLHAGSGEGIDVLANLVTKWPGKTLSVVVGAHLSKAHWDKGSFDDVMKSIFYHHGSHGAGQTVEQYTTDATTLWAGRAGTDFSWTDAHGRTCRKIQGPPGGTFTAAGQIYSFWYA